MAIKVIYVLSNVTTMRVPLETPKDYIIQQYMEDIKLGGRKHMFMALRSKEVRIDAKSGNKGEGISELDMAAHKVVFRYATFFCTYVHL